MYVECKMIMSILAVYEACLESKDNKVLNMYNIFNLQK